MAVPTGNELAAALRFIEEQTAAVGRAVAEKWPADSVEAIEDERDAVAQELRGYGYDADVAAAIERGEEAAVTTRTENKKPKSKKKPRKKKGTKKKRAKKPKFDLDWEEHKGVPNVELHSAPLFEDMRVVVGRPQGGDWQWGFWTPESGFLFDDTHTFTSKTLAKKKGEEEAHESLRMVEQIRLMVPRAANRDVGDVVLAARQYQRAVEDRMAAMDRGTPEELARSTKREKEAKEALEDMTGANRELIGAIGGAALGAALGGLVNPIAAAIGALAMGAIGSVVARPSLPTAPTPEQTTQRRPERDRDVIPFPRRPTGGRAANRKGRR